MSDLALDAMWRRPLQSLCPRAHTDPAPPLMALEDSKMASEIETRTTDGTLTCGLVQASCRCIRNQGHEGPHECECQGSWDFDADGQFVVVALPNPAMSPFLTD